jgi:GntR family transcriptional regulator
MDDQISRSSATPLYRQISQLIVRQIDEGQLEPGAMTSEQELAARYGVSRMTVRQAIDRLEREGRLFRVQGKGTFVAEPRKLEPQSALTSFSENMRALGKRPSYRTISVVEMPASADIARRLSVEANSKVLCISRVLLADDVPMALMRAYLPPWVYGDKRQLFSETRLNEVSLYETLEGELGIKLWKAKETVEAIAAGGDAGLLGLGRDALLLVVHRHSQDVLGRPVEYVQLRYRADLYRYQVELFRQGFGLQSDIR